MLYGFDPEINRKVIIASPSIFSEPTYHPDRVSPEFHDIFYIIEGYWNIFLEDEEINFIPGDIAMLPARRHHYSRQVCKRQTRTIFIHFTPEQSDQSIMDSTNNDCDLLLVQSHSHDNGSVLKYFQDILKYFWSDDRYKEQRCSAALYLLLSEISDINRRVNSQKHDKLILDLLNFMTGNPDKFFTITELADKACVSPKSLTTRFRKETGQSLHKYQMNRKLDQVASILESESGIGLKIIADSFGFYDEFHLSSAFKKKFNITPKNYGLGKRNE